MRQSRVSTGNPRQKPFFAPFRMLPIAGPLGFSVTLETLIRPRRPMSHLFAESAKKMGTRH